MRWIEQDPPRELRERFAWKLLCSSNAGNLPSVDASTLPGLSKLSERLDPRRLARGNSKDSGHSGVDSSVKGTLEILAREAAVIQAFERAARKRAARRGNAPALAVRFTGLNSNGVGESTRTCTTYYVRSLPLEEAARARVFGSEAVQRTGRVRFPVSASRLAQRRIDVVRLSLEECLVRDTTAYVRGYLYPRLFNADCRNALR